MPRSGVRFHSVIRASSSPAFSWMILPVMRESYHGTQGQASQGLGGCGIPSVKAGVARGIHQAHWRWLLLSPAAALLKLGRYPGVALTRRAYTPATLAL